MAKKEKREMYSDPDRLYTIHKTELRAKHQFANTIHEMAPYNLAAFSECIYHPSTITLFIDEQNTGQISENIIQHIAARRFPGQFFVVNVDKSPKPNFEIPLCDLAIIILPNQKIPPIINHLLNTMHTKGFILLEPESGKLAMEDPELQEVLANIQKESGFLIGPNSSGIFCEAYAGITSEEMPFYSQKGCDLVSSNNAISSYMVQQGAAHGLSFSSLVTVGDSSQIGVEEILAYWNLSYNSETSSPCKLIYFENLQDPGAFLYHASALRAKGCHIAACIGGASRITSYSELSSKASQPPHDYLIDALFKKAGIVHCYSRTELLQQAIFYTYPKPAGAELAIISFTDGPEKLLVDALVRNNMPLSNFSEKEHLEYQNSSSHAGISKNPITISKHSDNDEFKNTVNKLLARKDQKPGSICVIFDSQDRKKLLERIKELESLSISTPIPLYPILPSLFSSNNEDKEFIIRNKPVFQDEFFFAQAFSAEMAIQKHEELTQKPVTEEQAVPIDYNRIRTCIAASPKGFLPPDLSREILHSAGIQTSEEWIITELIEVNSKHPAFKHFPIVMKVVGPVHKTEYKGVIYPIYSIEDAKTAFNKLITIPEVNKVLIQPVHTGIELAVGALRNKGFIPAISCSLGGIFNELYQDIAISYAPVTRHEAYSMIRSLRCSRLFQGIKGQLPLDIETFTDIIVRVSELMLAAPEIEELYIDPCFTTIDSSFSGDVKIVIKRT